MIFCDCGIDTGYDAYKALALGADAVAVGRGFLAPLLKEGTEGVVKKVRKMNEQIVGTDDVYGYRRYEVFRQQRHPL